MRNSLLYGIVLLSIATYVVADTYSQSARGSNGRAREQAQKRKNANRCFNTQNNAAGGYGIAKEYLEVYAGCTMMYDWTVQHGSGRGENKADFIIQILWDKDQGALADTVRDLDMVVGADTNQIDIGDVTAQTLTQVTAKADQNPNTDRCRYESAKSYWHCSNRDQNSGLYHGPNPPAGASAQATRQTDEARQDANANTAYGFECQEEREYYPYWHPSDFRDVAVFSHNTSLCDGIKAESQNVKEKHLCEGDNVAQAKANNEADCNAAGGAWTATPPWGIDPPECFPAFHSRINHLGNADGTMDFAMYNYTIPTDMVGRFQFRQRYNMSVYELDHTADAGDNDVVIFKKDNPDVTISPDITLTLAFQTKQIFRTFEDRTGLIKVVAPPPEMANCAKCHIVMTRGGRGNIVQAYPGTEYDFAPNHLRMAKGDCMVLTWTGTDAWNAGDEGTGANIDKHNFVGLPAYDALFPLQVDDHEFPPLEAIPDGTEASRIAWIKKAAKGCSEVPDDTVMDQAPYACNHGVLGPFNTEGTWYSFCSRNNNFSNRGQKMVIHVGGAASAFTTAIASIGIFIALAGVVALGSMFYAKGHPNSAVARVFQNGGSNGSGILSSSGGRGGSRGSDRGGSRGGRSSRSGSRGSRSGKSRSSSKGSGYARH